MSSQPQASEAIAAAWHDLAQLSERMATQAPLIAQIAQQLSETFSKEHKLLIAGNGGSAADAQHIAAELVHRYAADRRRALPAIALTTDTSILTAIANDWSADEIFSRQVEALGQKGDLLLLLSTSGRSRNLLAAARQGKKQGLTIIGLLGRDGGELRALCDISLIVPSQDTARIQEIHRCIYHLLCQQVEEGLV